MIQKRTVCSPKFGWSKANPPRKEDYQIDLATVHLERDWEALVKKVANQLVGEANSCPRFVVMINTFKTLGSYRAIRDFQIRLMESVFALLQKRFPQFAARNEQPVEPFTRCDEGTGISSGFYTGFHYDNGVSRSQNLPFVSLSYGPFMNVIGGNAALADARQYCKDRNLSPSDLFKRHDMKEAHEWRLREEYSVEIEADYRKDVPLVILNNQAGSGLVHGSMEYDRSNDTPGQPVSRPFGRVAMELNPFIDKAPDEIETHRRAYAKERFLTRSLYVPELMSKTFR